jgi:hypothetical protein
LGLAVILIGIVVAIFLSSFWGAILIVVGLILLFVPAVPYGYSSWRGRRGPSP